MPVVEVSDVELFDDTLAFARQWWDPEAAMLWNPDGAFPEFTAGRTLHQIPNSAWFAWSLLATGDPADEADAIRAIEAVLALQYDAPGAEYDGTFRQFLEWPQTPPDDATMWEDFDPNWRQFVGTTFALILEDFGDRLGDDLNLRVFEACRRAALGEPDGRIPTSYTNPALMRAWLDAWVGSRAGLPDLLARGETFAQRIVDRFDRLGTFDEFNSPTYYGMDLYALSFWQIFGPTPLFREQGRRLSLAIWSEMLDFYSPDLRNWAGPYTRSYGPDVTRSVAKAGVWFWAEFGRDRAPLPPLTADVHHGHDLTSGSVIARLHRRVTADLPGGCDRRVPRRVEAIIEDRFVVSDIGQDLMIGTESSDHDWGGWDQFMPFVAHWRAGDDVETLWLAGPRVLHADLEPAKATLRVEETDEIVLHLRADECRVASGRIDTGHRVIAIDQPMSLELGDHDGWTIRIAASEATLDFHPASVGQI